MKKSRKAFYWLCIGAVRVFSYRAATYIKSYQKAQFG